MLRIPPYRYIDNTHFVCQDGTADYAAARGYSVLSTRKPMGVTYLWNQGYRLGQALGYAHVVFANNDVLFSPGALEPLVRALDKR